MRVLVAIDDIIFGKEILEFAGNTFCKPGTLFYLLHITEPSNVSDRITALYGHGINHAILEDRIKSGSELLNELREMLQAKVDKTCPIEVAVKIGTAHHMILEVAEEWDADVIIMGSHGRRGISKLLLGSVSMSVLSNSNCATVIVKLSKEEYEQKCVEAQKESALASKH